MKYNLYYYLFYRLVRMNDVLFPEYKHMDNFPIVGAISTLFFFNLFFFTAVYDYFFLTKIFAIENIEVIIIALLLIINYLLLQWRGRDKKIYELFKNETIKQRNVGLFFTWLYIVGSWLGMFCSIFCF